MWRNIASSKGNENARMSRDIIEKKMPPPLIETAQKLAHECIEYEYKGCGEKRSWWKFW